MAYKADEVIPGLWQGSAPNDADVRGRFAMVVLAAHEWQPTLHVSMVLRVPFEDGLLSKRETQMVTKASELVVEALKRGDPVLVTCFAGLNRSGLITALALRRLGYSPSDAIDLVRRARGEYALSNPSFVQFINRS
jgi:protein-tyrosine phosphatase